MSDYNKINPSERNTESSAFSSTRQELVDSHNRDSSSFPMSPDQTREKLDI